MPQTLNGSNRWLRDDLVGEDRDSDGTRFGHSSTRAWLKIPVWLRAWAGNPGHTEPVDRNGPNRSCAKATQDACIAIRLGCVDEAEAILSSVAAGASRDAAWLNIRGVVYELRGDWPRAKRFYGKAMRADRRYAPAEQNMRRWFELFTFGRTRWPVALGDDRDGNCDA